MLELLQNGQNKRTAKTYLSIFISGFALIFNVMSCSSDVVDPVFIVPLFEYTPWLSSFMSLHLYSNHIAVIIKIIAIREAPFKVLMVG
jgi:hypothetical protein